VQTGI